jgi:predicted double-glycine peptidase
VRFLPLWLAIAFLPASVDARAADARTSAPAFAVKSLKDFRDENLVKQRYDYSCGAAAMATLLRYGLNRPVSEKDIVEDLFDGLSAEEAAVREREGFSLFDLQQVAQRRGYRAQGFRLEPEHLSSLQGPVIVFLETLGYRHYAVLKGVRGDRVYLADPSRGNIRMPAYRFLQAWLRDGAGVIFVIEPAEEGFTWASRLAPPGGGPIQPEVLAVRELLAIGGPYRSTAMGVGR